MNRKSMLTIGIATVWLAVLGGLAISAQDKYTVKVPGGLAFSEFRGYEAWQAISISRNERVVAVILGNPAMIDAYRAGIPGNGKPVPDGAKMAKIHWTPKQNEFFPDATVPGKLRERGLHGEGQQEVRGQRRMGICRVRLRRRVRYVHARHHGRHAAAGERRQVRVRVPHESEGERLRFHGLREAGEASMSGPVSYAISRSTRSAAVTPRNCASSKSDRPLTSEWAKTRRSRDRFSACRSAENTAPTVGRTIAWPIRITSRRDTHARMRGCTRSRSVRMASFQ